MLVADMKSENLSKGYIYVTGIEKLKERTTQHFT
jgi:DNA replication licensing factor MCM5